MFFSFCTLKNNFHFFKVRDLIASGQLEEAQELCNKHADEWMSKFSSDTVFRSEYSKAWADQRKFPVSELLPESSSTAVAAAAAKGPAGGKGGKAAAPAEKLVARGAEKAKDLIASLMLQASAEAARVKSGQQQSYDEEEESEPEMDAPKPTVAAPVKPTAPAKLVSDPAAKAAEVFNFKVELPQIEDIAFVLPTVAGTVAETRTKDQIREEQRLKSKEAEERKQRRQETTEKKRVKAAEYSKKSEEEERVAKVKTSAVAAAAAQQAKAAAAEAAALAAAAAVEAAEAAAEASGSKEAVAYYGKPSPSLNASALKPAAAAIKRPAGKGNLLKKLKKFYHQNETTIVIATVALLILFILLFASLY